MIYIINNEIELFQTFKSRDIIQYNCKICGRKVSKGSIYNTKEMLCKTCISKQTNLKKYGVEYISQIENIKSKKEKTLLNRYGVKNSYQLNKVKENQKRSMNNEKTKSKRKEFNLKKYGVENVFQSKEIREKIKQTNLKKYGVEYTFQAKKIKEKIWKTNIERYGVKNPCSVGLFFYDNEKFDSSWELAYWIYCKDHNIKIERNKKGFKLENGYNCYPDFIINNNQIIEIKGNWQKKKDDWKYKEKCYTENNILVLFDNDIKCYINYINEKYGKNYLKQFFRKNKSASNVEKEALYI